VIVKDADTKLRLSECLNKGNPPQKPSACSYRHSCLRGTGKSGYYKGTVSTDRETFMFDVGIAMQNLALAACALGLARCMSDLYQTQKRWMPS
jgi:nitroreductase